MPPREWRSIPGVYELALVRGASSGGEPDLLLDVPHGATRAAHFDALRAELSGEFPADLRDFFFVNTDVGAPEVALRVAELVVAADPRRSALVLRCLVPRTFVDCNRIIDADARPRASAAGEMTPGVHAWVKEPRDLELLLARYRAWRTLVEESYAGVCGRGGLALMVHSYAPRSIDVPVDERIVERLRAEYEPDRLALWPLRAEVDLITHEPGGRELASTALAEAAEREFAAQGFVVAHNAAYALHPVTLAHALASRYPDRTLCLELRRDLLVRAFTPFAEMPADAAKVERVASALARAAVFAFG